jgi:hypothetical protein
MQVTRNFVIPYFIYLMFVYLSPEPFREWLNKYVPGLDLQSIDLKKFVLPLVAVVIVHYLLSGWRRKLNDPFFNRVNENIVQRFKTELGDEFDSWDRIRPAFYHVVDSDPSLSYLSDRIKHNGLVWFGFSDLRLAAILTFCIWLLGACASSLLSKPTGPWITSAIISMVMVLVSVLGSQLTTDRHVQLSNEQLNQMFPLHKAEVLEALRKGRG